MQLTVNQLVVGSIPATGANFLRKVLPGSIRDLGSCGLGSNPSTETIFRVVSATQNDYQTANLS